MKGLSTLPAVIGGFFASPYLVSLVHDFIRDAPEWFPFVIIILISGVIYAVGVDILRGVAAGMLFGVFVFGANLLWFPGQFRFLPDVPPPF